MKCVRCKSVATFGDGWTNCFLKYDVVSESFTVYQLNESIHSNKNDPCDGECAPRVFAIIISILVLYNIML